MVHGSGVLRVPDQYLTIQSAINAANMGDTILVAAGRYYEDLSVSKSVAIIGESPATTTVYGTVEGYDSNSQGSPFYISADNVVIANMSIKQGDEYHGAIRATSSKNIVIKNNAISEGGYSGIAVAIENCLNFTINGNLIDQRGGRIHVRNSTIGEISGNNLTGLESYTLILEDSSSLRVLNNVISECDEGIQITSSTDTTLSGNKITSNSNGGIDLVKCPGSVLQDNVVKDSRGGISISESPNTLLRNNLISNSTHNFGVSGYAIDDFALDIDASNTIDSKPIYFLINQHDIAITPSTYPNIGYLAIVDSTRVTVEGLSLGNCYEGILLALTTNSIIKNNNISNTGNGIYLQDYSDGNLLYGNLLQGNDISIRAYYSSNNQVINNNMSKSGGVWIEKSSDETFFGNTMARGFKLVNTNNIVAYHNNFVGQYGYGGSYTGYTSNMDYPIGGSYYQDYDGVDEKSGVSQGIPGPDGIGDTANYSGDQYPLMAPVQLYDVGVWGGKTQYIELESNSTLFNFEINTAAKTIRFAAAGPEGTIGFCRVTIPKAVSESDYAIIINGNKVSYTNFTSDQSIYDYVSYQNQTLIPEFPVNMILWLLLSTFLLFAVIKAVNIRKGRFTAI